MATDAAMAETVNIGNDSGTNIGDLGKLVLMVTDFHAAIESQPAPPGSVATRCPDLAKLHALTRSDPAVPLEEGIRRTFESYRAYWEATQRADFAAHPQYAPNGESAFARWSYPVRFSTWRATRAPILRRDEIEALRRTGNTVLAYFEIGSIENFRPEYGPLRRPQGLDSQRWDQWPDEFFVRYWDERWSTNIIRPRIDQALRAQI